MLKKSYHFIAVWLMLELYQTVSVLQVANKSLLNPSQY